MRNIFLKTYQPTNQHYTTLRHEGSSHESQKPDDIVKNQHHYSSPPKISSALSQEKKKGDKILTVYGRIIISKPQKKNFIRDFSEVVTHDMLRLQALQKVSNKRANS